MWFKIYHTKITSEQLLPHINSLHINLKFKPTHEIHNTIPFLYLLICRNTQGLDIDIYSKPTLSTYTTIHFSSNHPVEQQLAAYRYLINRMRTLCLNTKNKHKKWNIIL